MNRYTIWTLLLAVAALVGGAGLAAAEANFAATTFSDLADAHDLLNDVDVGDVTNDDSFCDQASGVDGLRAVDDLHSKRTDTERHAQTVSATDDNVLLAIALANNGASGVDWQKVRNFDGTDTRSMTASQTAHLDRNDVFSALALGIRDSGGSLDALSCVSDIDSKAEATITTKQTINLDEDTVLLSIALANSIGGDLNYDDIASMDMSRTLSVSHDRDVNIDRADTFLALALGNGGS